MTLIEDAKNQTLREEIGQISHDENLSIDMVFKEIANGRMIIPHNNKRDNVNTIAIGSHARVKTMTLIGSSTTFEDNKLELEKAKIAIRYGANIIADASTGPNLVENRRNLIKNINTPIAVTPIFEAATKAREREGACAFMNKKDILDAFENVARDGVDIIQISPALTQELLTDFTKNKRVMGMTTRSSLVLSDYMLENDAENPYYENFDKILKIAEEYDVVLAFSRALGALSVYDSLDNYYADEILILNGLIKKAKDANIQVMVGDVTNYPPNKMKCSVELTNLLIHRVPAFSIGGLFTNLAPGYDHIVSAVAETFKGQVGVDLISCSSPTEALFVPAVEDVREATVASSIAAHIIELCRNNQDAWDLEEKMANARKNNDIETQYEIAIDSKKAEEINKRSPSVISWDCGECKTGCLVKKILTRHH